MHIEFIVRIHCGPQQPARMVTRRFKDFDRLDDALARHARLGALERRLARGQATLPLLPRESPPMGRRLSAEFAEARQAALELWLRQVVARPQLWCDELRAFLGMPPPDEPPPAAPRAAPSAAHQSALGRTSPDAELGELRRIHAKMRAEGSGLKLEGGGVARGSNVVKWLLAQALAGSREQAVTLAEAMRRHGLLQPTGRKGDRPFVDGSARYRLAAAWGLHAVA